MRKLSSASDSFCIGAFPSTKRTSSSCPSPPAIVKFQRQLRLTRYYSSFHKHHEGTGIYSKKKDHLCHAVPLPAVATGTDSEGSASSSSTDERECKVGADRIKDPDLLMRFQRGFEVLNKVCQKTRSSRWTVYGMNAWESMPPWIKLPTAIFLPWFLFISLLYGPSASMDLLPLWIIGPFMVGLFVKLSMKTSTACQQWLADKNLKETTLYVIEAIWTGQ
ncbi:hypothetical protein L7F22_002678 [Adiantum nelumboides]|nr:hypothetical protein [Adiantum nelumboides]